MNTQERQEHLARQDLNALQKRGAYVSGKILNRIRASLGLAKLNVPRLEKTLYREFGIGRNSPCPCGSGKKVKNCCGR